MSCKGEKKRRGYHIMVSDRDFPSCETCQADSGYAAGAEVGRAVKALELPSLLYSQKVCKGGA